MGGVIFFIDLFLFFWSKCQICQKYVADICSHAKNKHNKNGEFDLSVMLPSANLTFIRVTHREVLPRKLRKKKTIPIKMSFRSHSCWNNDFFCRWDANHIINTEQESKEVVEFDEIHVECVSEVCMSERTDRALVESLQAEIQVKEN